MEYKPGKHDGDADALSRMNTESVRAACEALAEDQWGKLRIFMETDPSTVKCHSLVSGENIDWKEEQMKDSTLRRVISILARGFHVNPSKEKSSVVLLLRHRKRLKVIEGILFRVTVSKKRVILPIIIIINLFCIAQQSTLVF